MGMSVPSKTEAGTPTDYVSPQQQQFRQNPLEIYDFIDYNDIKMGNSTHFTDLLLWVTC